MNDYERRAGESTDEYKDRISMYVRGHRANIRMGVHGFGFIGAVSLGTCVLAFVNGIYPPPEPNSVLVAMGVLVMSVSACLAGYGYYHLREIRNQMDEYGIPRNEFQVNRRGR